MKKNNKLKNSLPNNIGVDEILNDIDIKIQEIESDKKKSEMTKTRIDDVDAEEIIKVLDDKCKQLKKKEENHDL